MLNIVREISKDMYGKIFKICCSVKKQRLKEKVGRELKPFFFVYSFLEVHVLAHPRKLVREDVVGQHRNGHKAVVRRQEGSSTFMNTL